MLGQLKQPVWMLRLLQMDPRFTFLGQGFGMISEGAASLEQTFMHSIHACMVLHTCMVLHIIPLVLAVPSRGELIAILQFLPSCRGLGQPADPMHSKQSERQQGCLATVRPWSWWGSSIPWVPMQHKLAAISQSKGFPTPYSSWSQHTPLQLLAEHKSTHRM